MSYYITCRFDVERPLHRAQIFCLSIIQQYGRVIWRGDAIGQMFHYTKNPLSSPCTSLHKHEQKMEQRLQPNFQTMSLLTMIMYRLAAKTQNLQVCYPICREHAAYAKLLYMLEHFLKDLCD